MWILGLEGFFKLKMILLTNLQSKSNNSFHRTYLRVAHVCSEKGKDPGLTLNSECHRLKKGVSVSVFVTVTLRKPEYPQTEL